ncbi:MAG: S8 family serine peptidase [Coriobacteriales bacterium]
MDHPDLEDNLNTDLAYDAYNKTSLVSEVDSSFCGDRVGHGTHVAGIIAAEANNGEGIAGTSYNAEVLPIKVFDDSSDDTSTTTEVLVRAYEYLEDCIDSGELTDLHVINMSLGGYGESEGDQELESAIETLYDDYDVVTVCAGGNGDDYGNPITSYSYPADFDVCLSVTALNPDGTNATWSDFNDKKDISAPGVNIWSTWISDSSSNVKEVDSAYYACEDGTSMASPVVAGAVALCFAADPDATADEVVAAIKDTADEVDDSSDSYSRNSTGVTYRYWGGSVTVVSGSAGALNAAEAVAEITGTTLTTTSTSTAGATTDTSASSSSVSVGKSYTAGTGAKKASYLVKKKATSKSAGKVYYRRSLVSKKAKKATVPAKVKIKGKTYKVVGISKKAFSKRKKLRTITVKSPYLTNKKAVKGSLKGSKIRTVKVSVTGKAKRAKVRAAFKKKAWVGRKVRVK